jgi:hypothetical protein
MHSVKFISISQIVYLRILQKNKPADPHEHKMKDTVYEGISSTLDACIKHEKEMEEVLRSARSNYRFKGSTNGILVILGTILIISPILFTWMKSTTNIINIKSDSDVMNLTRLNYFLGGIGIVAFVTTFFKRPQQNMTEAIADLAQLFMICIMYNIICSNIILGRLSP